MREAESPEIKGSLAETEIVIRWPSRIWSHG